MARRKVLERVGLNIVPTSILKRKVATLIRSLTAVSLRLSLAQATPEPGKGKPPKILLCTLDTKTIKQTKTSIMKKDFSNTEILGNFQDLSLEGSLSDSA